MKIASRRDKPFVRDSNARVTTCQCRYVPWINVRNRFDMTVCRWRSRMSRGGASEGSRTGTLANDERRAVGRVRYALQHFVMLSDDECMLSTSSQAIDVVVCSGYELRGALSVMQVYASARCAVYVSACR